MRNPTFLGLLLAVYGVGLTLALTGPAMVRGASLIIAVLFASVCLLLPRAAAIAVSSTGIGIALVLREIGEAKITLTELPLTMLDLRIAAANPAGTLAAVDAPMWLTPLLTVRALAGVLLLIGVLILQGTMHRSLGRRDQYRSAVTIGLALAGSYLFVNRLGNSVASSGVAGTAWGPAGVTQLARLMGHLPFLIYSVTLERENSGSLYFSAPDRPPPSLKIATAAGMVAPGRQLAPNVIMVLMESTFNVNRAFQLRSPVLSPVYASFAETQAVLPLRVNAVGGGTWITEFETITGVDSRLFGYSGFYTHAAVAPYVRNSLPLYLRRHGYQTSAYYPVSGKFYNARNAYRFYGFERFTSLVPETSDIWLRSDAIIAERAILTENRQADNSPALVAILLLENHSPHPCDADAKTGPQTLFLAAATSDETCTLNAYLHRQAGTAVALEKLRAWLRAKQKHTGRPWLLVAYGDHQPYSFTGGDVNTVNPMNFSRFRTGEALTETLVRIEGTARLGPACCMGQLPDWLLPTIISGAVAHTPDDLYLPINLALRGACGTDILPLAQPPAMTGLGKLVLANVRANTSGCGKTVDGAIATYRVSKVVATR